MIGVIFEYGSEMVEVRIDKQIVILEQINLVVH